MGFTPDPITRRMVPPIAEPPHLDLRSNASGSDFHSLEWFLDQWDFQGPLIMGPPYGKRDPYHSHIFRDSYGSGMGLVWEAYHKGVPLLGGP